MPPLSPAAQRLAESLAEQHLLDGVRRLLVGFSGGADSTALLLLLRELEIPLAAHHFHHGLRGADADADAAWCESFCARRAIPFACHHLHVPEHQHSREGTEAAARRCRLEQWRELATPGDAVALGHHADDALETLLLRLARGANASGLAALRPRRTIGGILILRPLLPFTPAELRDHLRSQGIDDWREDHTNADPAHRRNAVRHRLLPLFRDIFAGDAGLRQTLAALHDDADYLETQAANALHPAMSREDWRNLPPALLPRTLRRWLETQTGQDIPLRHTDLDRLRQTLAQPPSPPRTIPLADGPVLILDHTGLRLEHTSPPLPERHWNWRENPVLILPEIHAELAVVSAADTPGETFAADQLPPILTVRSRRPGDRLVPFGGTTPKKVQDLLVDARVPRDQRDSIPLLLVGQAIIWVPGLRRAEFARATPGQPTVRIVLRSPATGCPDPA